MSQVRASLPDGTTFDFAVHAGVDQYISARIQKRGSWEPFETNIMVSMLGPGDVVVDIGANIGWHTVVCGLTIGPSGRVICFEPDAANADLLERNVALNHLDNVRVFRCALSETTGTVQFNRSADNMGDHRIDPVTRGSDSTRVPTDTLDRMVAAEGLDLGKARIVKIDTQGAELMVFRGARQTLTGLPEECAVFVEFSPNLLRRHTPDSADGFLRMLDILSRDVYVVDARFRTLHPIDKGELQRFAAECAGASDDVGLDLILVPRGSKEVRSFERFYAPLRKCSFLRRKTR